jgi:hypothetical protein
MLPRNVRVAKRRTSELVTYLLVDSFLFQPASNVFNCPVFGGFHLAPVSVVCLRREPVGQSISNSYRGYNDLT